LQPQSKASPRSQYPEGHVCGEKMVDELRKEKKKKLKAQELKGYN
jgi:hypothetical protein